VTTGEPAEVNAARARPEPRARPRWKRRRRFLFVAHAFTALTFVVCALALSAIVPARAAVAVAAVLWIGTALRFPFVMFDHKRPRWQVRFVDLPMFWHWGACFFGALAFAVTGPVLALAHVLGLTALGASGLALGCYAAGLVVSAWAAGPGRRWVRVRRIEVPVPGLSLAFDGYRIAQLSDLHIGSFAPRARGARWAELANACRPDLAVVTGDLVTSGTEFYQEAIDVVAGLRAPDGVVAVLGNHDQSDSAELERGLLERNVRVLDNRWTVVRRGESELCLAGVGDRWTHQTDLDAALSGRPSGAPTVLLAHDPECFERAAACGVELTLSGHTHGGQIGVPFVARRLNVARLARQRPQGLVRLGASFLYVTAGLGTTGPPLRLGIPPEVALLVLRAV
jgi:uncharacterized protein